MMRKPNFLDRLPKDKLLHFAIGTVVMAACMLVLSINHSLAITALVGIGIEIYQKVTNTGNFELMDAFAVILGGLVVASTGIQL